MLGSGTPHIEEAPGKQTRTSRGVQYLPRSSGIPSPLGNKSTRGGEGVDWEYDGTWCERVTVVAGASAVAPRRRYTLETETDIGSSCWTRICESDHVKYAGVVLVGTRQDDDEHRRLPRMVEQ